MRRFPVLAYTVVATNANGETFTVEHVSPLADVTARAQCDQLVSTLDWSGEPLAEHALVMDSTGAITYDVTRVAEVAA